MKKDRKVYDNKYNNSEKGKITRKRAMDKYNKTEKAKLRTEKYLKSDKGMKTRNEYQQSDRGRKVTRKANNKYHFTEKYRIAKKRYEQSEKGRLYNSKKLAEKRGLGFDLIFENKLDEPYAFHHLNKNMVIAIPEDLHRLYSKDRKEGDGLLHKQFCLEIGKQLYREPIEE